MRLIEASFPSDLRERVTNAAERAEPLDWRTDSGEGDGRCHLKVLVKTQDAQDLVDKLQSILEGAETWRVVVLTVEATAPKLEDVDDQSSDKQNSTMALREEIYEDVTAGTALTQDFLVLTILSAIVAGIGMNTDNVAVVIGAMVIAPLLGPILAFSFAGALGDLKLMVTSAKSAIVGMGLGMLTAVGLGVFLTLDLQSKELISRADLRMENVALALASGAAAALSLITGLSSALVGVMVAVALAPPAVAVGLFLGAGELSLAGRALLVLALNVVCVSLAAQIIYWWKGIRPRTWLERKSAKRSMQINIAVWATLLVGISGLIIALNR